MFFLEILSKSLVVEMFAPGTGGHLEPGREKWNLEV
jgi:hypothetical protein